MKVLDFGARDGQLKAIIEFYLKQASVTSLDKEPQNHNVEHFEWTGNNKLPFNDNEFDVIVCIGTMNYIPYKNVNGLIQEFNRVLRTDGKLIIAYSWKLNPFNFDGVSYFHCDHVAEIFRTHKRTIKGYLSYIWWEATK